MVGRRRRARRVTRKQIVILSGAGACAVGTFVLTGDLRYLLEFLSWLLRTMATLAPGAG